MIGYCIILLLWNSAVEQLLGFSYIDELITLIFGIYFVASIGTKRYKPNKNEFYILVFTLLFYFTGMVPTLIHNFQNDVLYGASSGFFSIKMYVCFLGARCYLRKKQYNNRKLKRLLKIVETPLLPVSVVLIADQFFNFFPYAGIRLGLKSSQFLFTHPTEVACFAVVSMLLSYYLREILGLNKRLYLNCFPAIIIVLISGRYKALGFLTLFVSISLALPYIKKFKLRYIAIGIPGTVLVVYDQVLTYFSDMSLSARGLLYSNALAIARDFFPLGSGFGTYGTEFSRARYSIVYHIYHMDNTYGLAPSAPFYICDAMWAAILGETGVLGILVVIGIIYNIVIIIRRVKVINKRIAFYMYAILIYLIIESIADTIFMSSKGCLIVITLAIMISIAEQKQSRC